MTQSPQSSLGDDESVGGTPNTRLTAFSPEDNKDGKFSNSTNSIGTRGMLIVADPFITEFKAKAEQKLSPTATAFQPFGLSLHLAGASKPITSATTTSSAPIPGTAQHLQFIIAAEENSPRRRAPQGAVSKYGQFTTETRAGRHIKVESLFKNEDISQVIEESLEKHNASDYISKGSVRWESIDGVVFMRVSHRGDSLTIYNAIKKDHDNLEVVFIQPNDSAEIVTPLSNTGSFSAYEGQVKVRIEYPLGCDKIKFEAMVRAYLEHDVGTLCAWEKVPSQYGIFCMVAEFYDTANDVLAVQKLNGKTPEAHSKSKLSVSLHRPSVHAHKPTLSRTSNATTPGLHTPTSSPDSLQPTDAVGGVSVGKGKAPQTQSAYPPFTTPMQSPSGLSFMPSSAGFSTSSMSQYAFSGMSSPQIVSPSQFGQMVTPSQFGMTTFAAYHDNRQGMSPNGYMGLGQMGSRQFSGPSGYGTPSHSQFSSPSHFDSQSPTSNPFGYVQRSPARRQNASKIPHPAGQGYRNRNQLESNASHNVVDPDKIYWGSDVRTTVMLRNIPNKCSQEQLKAIIDESSHGRYDFMYLRIDFSNECNVGYAFVNFVDPLDIIEFYKARSGQRWDNYRSDKRAEVSYATIQGRDCLIQKFRNSSVMLEPDYCRPKLYFAHPSPLFGQEEPFPTSDNAAKLQRSCQNAEHVGLFAPSAGQHLRNEQRNRRSQYDRGTSMAEQEDGGFALEWPTLGYHHQPAAITYP